MLRECGTVIDYWKEYIPVEHTERNHNGSWDIAAACLKRILTAPRDPNACPCPFSCYEVSYDTVFRKLYHLQYNSVVEIHINYPKNSFTSIKEYEAYPKSKFLTDIGGWCGLFTGMSFLSIVEILVFLTLALVAFCKNLKDMMG